MGGSEFSKEYLERLLKEIDESFENFVKLNDGKNIFNAARTPAVFFTLVVLGYFLSSVFGSVGLVAFVRMCNLVIWSGLLAIVVWSYIRFSGEFREYGAKLDHVAELIWDEVRLFLFPKSDDFPTFTTRFGEWQGYSSATEQSLFFILLCGERYGLKLRLEYDGT